MITENNVINVFFELLRAGLWENEARLSSYSNIDFEKVLLLAEEQSVVGLVAAGLEHVIDQKVPQDIMLQFVGEILQLEQQNSAMNQFVGKLVEKMREADIYTILVKGQGIAQCYERPLWRACGDVDFLLSNDNYKKAKEFLMPLASSVEGEDKWRNHISMNIDSWIVELHGTLWTGISKRIDRGIDEVQKDVFFGGNVRSWNNNTAYIFLPSPNNDVIIVFTHFLKHFFKGGIGLRQVCDWCRLMHTYKDKIDARQLELRLKKMGIMSEWRTFATLAVYYLNMPTTEIPLYSSSTKYKNKAKKSLHWILETGNMGHNVDQSYRTRYPFLIEKTITLVKRSREFMRLMTIFPCDSPKYLVTYTYNGIKRSLSIHE